MQTYLSSHRSSSRFSARRAFTLIELLISAAIITIITSIVLVRFTAFDSTVLLKSAAYDVGMAIREAQIFSVSVINTGSGSGANFRYPYGLSFTRGASSYIFFRYDSATVSSVPAYNANPDDGVPETVLRVNNVGSSLQIADICIVRSNVGEICGRNKVDISFKRPEFIAHFYDSSLGNPTTNPIESVRIHFNSTRDTTRRWVVEVKLLGQILVYPT